MYIYQIHCLYGGLCVSDNLKLIYLYLKSTPKCVDNFYKLGSVLRDRDKAIIDNFRKLERNSADFRDDNRKPRN